MAFPAKFAVAFSIVKQNDTPSLIADRVWPCVANQPDENNRCAVRMRSAKGVVIKKAMPKELIITIMAMTQAEVAQAGRAAGDELAQKAAQMEQVVQLQDFNAAIHGFGPSGIVLVDELLDVEAEATLPANIAPGNENLPPPPHQPAAAAAQPAPVQPASQASQTIDLFMLKVRTMLKWSRLPALSSSVWCR